MPLCIICGLQPAMDGADHCFDCDDALIQETGGTLQCGLCSFAVEGNAHKDCPAHCPNAQ